MALPVFHSRHIALGYSERSLRYIINISLHQSFLLYVTLINFNLKSEVLVVTCRYCKKRGVFLEVVVLVGVNKLEVLTTIEDDRMVLVIHPQESGSQEARYGT